MPELSSITAFAALSFVLIFIPGPSVMFVVSRAIALGRRAALVTVLGNAAGVYVQLLLVAAGLGAMVESSIALFAMIKFAGALYLAWLGIQAIRHRRRLGDALDGTAQSGSGRTVFTEGFIVGIANPKAIVFFAAILPQFVAPGGAPAGVQMAALGIIFVLIALVSDSLWGVTAGTARQWLARSPRRLEWLGTAGGAVMILLGAQLALSGNKN